MEQQVNYLEDLEQEVSYEYASKGARFVNFLIDYIAISGLSYAIDVVYGAIIVSQANIEDFSLTSDPWPFILMQYAISIGTYVGYYTIFEISTGGRSLGKFVTNSIALRQNGNKLRFKDALLRSLCRVIPFETIAALFTIPWHDSITNTMVVKKNWN